MSGSRTMRAAMESFVPSARCGFKTVGPCHSSILSVPAAPRLPPDAAAAGAVVACGAAVGAAAAAVVGAATAAAVVGAAAAVGACAAGADVGAADVLDGAAGWAPQAASKARADIAPAPSP